MVNNGTNSLLLSSLLSKDNFFDTILSNKDKYKVQIIYTEINRDNKNKPSFTDHYFDINDTNYFYPASTIKFPVALLSLEKLNELAIPGVDKNTTMLTEAANDVQTKVYNDPTTPDGRPTIAHYIKKILLVSDNDASNRLYEFLGQEYLNDALKRKGYDAEIIHRLSIPLTEEQNRNTNPIRFTDTSGKTIHLQPPQRSDLVYSNRKTFLGKGYYSGGVLKNEPFDFSKKNKLPLTALHTMLKTVLFPEAVEKNQRFNLTPEDYQFLRKYMSMYSNESKFPYYDATEYGPNYIKFILAGAQTEPLSPGIRIFSKSGQAYGFLTDMAYVIDLEKNIEFMVTATIHCNSDGIYNDDNYDYDSVGFPFMKKLGEFLYNHELMRKRKNIPDLRNFRFNYSENP